MNKLFWINVGKKVIETIISVKVWIIFSLLIISTYLLINGFLDGKTWAAINGGVISTIVGLREAFKVAKVKSEDDTSQLGA